MLCKVISLLDNLPASPRFFKTFIRSAEPTSWGFPSSLKNEFHPLPPLHNLPPPRAMPPPPVVSPLLSEWQCQHPRWFPRCFHQNLSLTYFLSSFFTLPCTPKPVWHIASFRAPVNLFLEVWSRHLLLYDWHLCLGVRHVAWCTRVKKLIGTHSSSPSFSFLLLSPLSSHPHSINSVSLNATSPGTEPDDTRQLRSTGKY